jgi:hypothetical protein
MPAGANPARRIFDAEDGMLIWELDPFLKKCLSHEHHAGACDPPVATLGKFQGCRLGVSRTFAHAYAHGTWKGLRIYDALS